MAKRLLSVDPLSGLKTFHEYDHKSKTTYITESQDVSKILKHNRNLRNNAEYKSGGIKNDYYHFATIPMIMVMKFKNEHNLDVFNKDDLPAIERLLQGSEYMKLRTVDKI